MSARRIFPAPTALVALPLALLLAACGATSDASTDPGDTSTASATTDAPDSSSGPTTAAASDTGDDPSTGSTAAPTTAPDPTTTTDDPGDTTAATALTTGDDTGAPVEELPPIDSVEILEAWLAGGAYKQWAVESQVHASTGPHAGNVRTYVNAIALASLTAQNSEHPQDAATVKELYGKVSSSKFANARFEPGDRIRLTTPGGGGYGEPGERDREAVREDVSEGYVSEKAAREIYGLE